MFGKPRLLLEQEGRLAFVACEENAKLAVVDLTAKKMTAIHTSVATGCARFR